MLILKMILLFGVFLVLLFFADQNYKFVELYYGPPEPIQVPLFLLLMISVLSGMLIALFIGIFDKLKLKKEVRTLRKEKDRMEGELNSLRKMPIIESQRPEPGPEEPEPESTKESA